MPANEPKPNNTDGQGTADTEGWDTVSAITYSKVNEAIVKYSTYPKNFSQQADDKSVSVTGEFTGWKLTTGGAGQLIHLQITVVNGILVPDGEPSKAFDGSVNVEVQTEFVPQPEKPTSLNLKLAKRKPVAATKADLKGLTRLYAGAAMDLIASWLSDHLEEFNLSLPPSTWTMNC